MFAVAVVGPSKVPLTMKPSQTPEKARIPRTTTMTAWRESVSRVGCTLAAVVLVSATCGWLRLGGEGMPEADGSTTSADIRIAASPAGPLMAM